MFVELFWQLNHNTNEPPAKVCIFKWFKSENTNSLPESILVYKKQLLKDFYTFISCIYTVSILDTFWVVCPCLLVTVYLCDFVPPLAQLSSACPSTPLEISKCKTTNYSLRFRMMVSSKHLLFTIIMQKEIILGGHVLHLASFTAQMLYTTGNTCVRLYRFFVHASQILLYNYQNRVFILYSCQNRLVILYSCQNRLVLPYSCQNRLVIYCTVVRIDW